ncbi:Uncharacterized protein DBV15_08927 [Temnothorax longispinosus]|uniref:Uncharacterized protein n=1 Tax=Temnothorax longispinosus TaxID=300112 RepID=A0A4S2JFL9_9HYME|nr:Uncharacterized protein DBV15_08927 [Temnothorax longispinosus]
MDRRTPLSVRALLLISETKRLASTRELPPEKYNVKGLRVNSYITVGRRSDPKDRRDTILVSTYPENPSSSSPTYETCSQGGRPCLLCSEGQE